MAGYFTIGLLSQQDRNHYHHNGVLPHVEKFDMPGDRSFRGAGPARKFFTDVADNDFFRMSRRNRTSDVWFYLGYRVFVDYLDNNVMIDVQYPLEKTRFSRDEVVSRLQEKLSVRYDVRVVGENDILDVRQLQFES